MSSTASGLSRLHQLHAELEEVEKQLAEGPRKINLAKKLITTKKQEHDSQKELILKLTKAGDEKSLQLKSNEARIGDLRAKLNMAASNREYSIIKSQIDADAMANSVLEDEILEAYEKVDSAREELARIDAVSANAEEDAKKLASDVASAEAGLKSRAEELGAAINESESLIPAQANDMYRRLVQAHGAGALAALDADACGSCYTVLTPQERVQLNLGKVLFCRACGRLLYIEKTDA